MHHQHEPHICEQQKATLDKMLLTEAAMTMELGIQPYFAPTMPVSKLPQANNLSVLSI
jgi:hypothetical protein